MKYEVPPAFEEKFSLVYDVPKVLEAKAYFYKPEIYSDDHCEFHSMWVLTFFDTASFVGFIRSTSEWK